MATEDPATFCEATVCDPRVVALRDRVTVTSSEARPGTASRVVVDAAGARLEAETDTGTPAANLVEQRERLERKFERLAAPVLGAARATSLCEMLRSVDELGSIRELVAGARPDLLH